MITVKTFQVGPTQHNGGWVWKNGLPDDEAALKLNNLSAKHGKIITVSIRSLDDWYPMSQCKEYTIVFESYVNENS